MPIKNIKDYSKDKKQNSILIIGKGILLAYVISIICIMIYGILLVFTGLSESSMSTVITVITLVCIALAGIYTAIKGESRGWLNGAIVGIVYMIILIFLSLLFKTGMTLDKFVLFRIFMGFVIGTLSGIIGVNLK